MSMPTSRILLIEDDPVLGDLVWRNLVARGHEVRLAQDARAALAELRSAPFHLVILDIDLPDQTGWEVLRIAQREGWVHARPHEDGPPRLPVVVVSGVRASLARLKEFAPLAYLPKPFPLEALLRLVQEASRQRQEVGVKEPSHL